MKISGNGSGIDPFQKDFTFFARSPNPYLSLILITRGEEKMIRERIISSTIRAVSFDQSSSTLVVESKEGTVTRHSPVKYDSYHAIVSSRFPDRIYRHLIVDHIVPVAMEGK